MCDTTGAARGAGVAYPSGAPELTPGFYWANNILSDSGNMAESGIEDITRSDKEDVTIQMESIKEEGASDTATQEKSLPVTFGNKRRCCKVLKVALYSLLTMGYFVYFGFALALNFRKAIPLLCVTGFVCFCVIYHILRRLCSKFVFRNYTTCRERIKSRISARKKRICLIGICVIVILSLLTYVVISNLNTPENLISFVGIAVLLMMSWLISYNRQQIKWRPMVWGMTLQLLLGLFVLRTTAGKETFSFLGEQVETFLNYVVAGVRFVFGDKYKDFEFAFKLMPTVIFLSSVISVLYHMGLMQIIVEKIAVLMQVTMGTTAAETLSTAASIFLGQPEASLTIRPYLGVMTHSELHAIMTAGFASVSADIFGLFVSYGIKSSHILTAVLMSAPAGLVVSKIIYPETEESKTKTWKQIKEIDTYSDTNNIVDAAGRGAQDAVHIVFAVGATLIAFLSILQFLNTVLQYLGSLVNIENLSFELILSYVLMPLVFIMGVPWADCRVVGEVVGLKTVVNEFVGYERLSKYIKSDSVSIKAQVIATYALCGFSNPTTIGITLGGLGALIPERRKTLSNLVFRAWIAGNIACFLTACFAGLLYQGDLHPLKYNATLP